MRMRGPQTLSGSQWLHRALISFRMFPEDAAPAVLPLLLSYAHQVHQGLLYVWPDAFEGAAAAAASSPLPIIPELDQTDEWEPRTDWFMRDVPISMETVVENVSSRANTPAH